MGCGRRSFEMPKTDIETDVIFGEKQKVVLSGDDRETDYDGTSKSVNEWIRAEAGGTNISEVLQDEYEVQYEGVGETIYSSTTPPTNAGTYSCIVKIPESNVSYTADPVAVRLTIKNQRRRHRKRRWLLRGTKTVLHWKRRLYLRMRQRFRQAIIWSIVSNRENGRIRRYLTD